MTLREDEYIDNDGLIRCSLCNTLREKILHVVDDTFRVRMRCKCQAEEDDRQRTQRRRQEQMDQVSRLRSSQLQDPRLRQYQFSHDNGRNSRMDVARSYLAHWKEMEAAGRGLLLFGNTGTGKSFMAGCIANALLDQGVPVLMTTLSQILQEISATEWEQKPQVISGLNAYRLLILDDLGIERKSEYILEQMYNVVDGRHRSGLPMIITTNLTLQELQNPGNLALQRIYDRILERCAPVLVNDSNMRKKYADDTREHLKDILY